MSTNWLLDGDEAVDIGSENHSPLMAIHCDENECNFLFSASPTTEKGAPLLFRGEMDELDDGNADFLALSAHENDIDHDADDEDQEIAFVEESKPVSVASIEEIEEEEVKVQEGEPEVREVESSEEQEEEEETTPIPSTPPPNIEIVKEEMEAEPEPKPKAAKLRPKDTSNLKSKPKPKIVTKKLKQVKIKAKVRCDDVFESRKRGIPEEARVKVKSSKSKLVVRSFNHQQVKPKAKSRNPQTPTTDVQSYVRVTNSPALAHHQERILDDYKMRWSPTRRREWTSEEAAHCCKKRTAETRSLDII